MHDYAVGEEPVPTRQLLRMAKDAGLRARQIRLSWQALMRLGDAYPVLAELDNGNWVGIDGPGRVMVAQALFSNFGGGGSFSDYDVADLCSPDELQRASQWGLAMRLGQRLSGGVAASLERSSLSLERGVLLLTLSRQEASLYGEAVERRLRTLANALGCKAEVEIG